jgi:hypothetical protein
MRCDTVDSITCVAFARAKANQIEGRGICEDDVLEALIARREDGDLEAVRVGEGRSLRGGRSMVYRCRVPRSGRYLHVVIEIMADGTAWCYHAREMTLSERRRFEGAQ